MEMNRRNFLKAAGAAGVASAALSGVALADETAAEVEYPKGACASDYECSPVEVAPITEFAAEYTYDVVVVGGGTGGVPAALTVIEEGATACVLQKESVCISQGANESGVELEMSDPQGIKNYIRGYMESVDWRADRGLVEYYTYHSGETMRWLRLRAEEAGNPPANVSTEEDVYEDGTKSVRHEWNYGPKPQCNLELIMALANLAEERGVDFYYETPGVQLIQGEDGTVTGVVGKNAAGEYIKFNATMGVILSTGDYQNNESLVERYCPDILGFDRKQFGKTGDGILMAMQLGAGMVQTGHCHMMHDFDSGPMASVPFMAVNMDGNRFMNEDMPFTMINVQMRDQPKPGWFVQIYDGNYETTVPEMGFKATPADAVQKWMPEVEMDRSVASGNKVIEGLVDLYCADTLEELAEKIEVPADALIASVERYNELVDAGFDEDFGKNPKYLKKIEQAPFWGARKHIRVSALCAGMTVNENYQVITTEGEVIPHLWATGFGAGQLCGAPDWSMYQSGMSAGHCFTSGRYTAIHAVTGGLEPSKPVMWEDIADLVPEQ